MLIVSRTILTYRSTSVFGIHIAIIRTRFLSNIYLSCSRYKVHKSTRKINVCFVLLLNGIQKCSVNVKFDFRPSNGYLLMVSFMQLLFTLWNLSLYTNSVIQYRMSRLLLMIFRNCKALGYCDNNFTSSYVSEFGK